MAVAPIPVLLIEDNPADARLVQEYLYEEGRGQFVLTQVSRLEEGMALLNKAPFEVLLLDLTLPDSQGLNTLVQIQQAKPSLPIVVLSGLNDEQVALQAVARGAQDYLVKGQGFGALLARALTYAIERKQSEQRLAQLAYYDVLTGLANRAQFQIHLVRALSRAQRNQNLIALVLLDLDHFKNINDTLGHDAGDNLLITVAQRLKTCVRQHDTVARLGGDEFTLILESLKQPDDADIVVKKIQVVLNEPVSLGGHHMRITPSIGITLYPKDGQDPATLIKQADIALYWVKERGRNQYAFYQPQMSDQADRRLSLESDLHRALQQDELQLYYQPMVDLNSGRITGLEALLRWPHPDRGLILPADFIPLAEKTDLIMPLGAWVLRTACAQMKAWQAQGLMGLTVSVNLSARQFMQDNLIDRIDRILLETGLEPVALELEITESFLVKDTPWTIQALHALRERGIKIVVDDFGTGFSSLNYLKRLPLNRLKIPREFVQDLPHDAHDMAIALSIIALAHNFHLDVIAEGVETRAQLDFLKAKQCDGIQGYYISPPVPVEKATPLLVSERKGTLGFPSKKKAL